MGTLLLAGMPATAAALLGDPATPTHIPCVAAQSVRRFEYWRWGFYFACWFPICWLTSLAIKLLVKLVESQLLAADRNILYYTASVKASHICSISCTISCSEATWATNMGLPRVVPAAALCQASHNNVSPAVWQEWAGQHKAKHYA